MRKRIKKQPEKVILPKFEKQILESINNMKAIDFAEKLIKFVKEK